MDNCYHCGDEVITRYEQDDHVFCCNGCVSVYQIISGAGLKEYYSKENDTPGIKNSKSVYLDYLSSPDVVQKLLVYKDENRSVVKFILPSIHCASCVWLLERLAMLNPGIISSEVDFLSKKITIHYNHNKTTLKEIGELLLSIGYEPKLDLSKGKRKINHLIIRIGVAGFCFGNIMLLSFPEYFEKSVDEGWGQFFSYLNVLLSLPIIFYSAIPFYRGVTTALKAKKISVDLLIVLGIGALLGRSLFEIFLLGGSGYLDSLAGLIFFLLIGKWFQAKVFSELSFEKENSSYLPLAVLKEVGDDFVVTPLEQIQKGDEIRLRNGEVVPFKCVLKSEKGKVDNSFITGEELPIAVSSGDILYVGGQVQGELIEVVVMDLEGGSLNELWREKKTNEEHEEATVKGGLITGFTFFVLFVALGTFIYWSNYSLEKAFVGATSVLIIACPCALALSAPTVYGLIMRLLSQKGMYVKSASVIKRMASVKELVFDKTGTITGKKTSLKWIGDDLSLADQSAIGSIIKNSSHPLASELGKKIKGERKVENFKEQIGQGVSATVDGEVYKIGTAEFLGGKMVASALSIHVVKENTYLGRFELGLSLRKGMDKVLNDLRGSFKTYLLSGDPNLRFEEYEPLFPKTSSIIKGASPAEKKSFIESKNQVLMLGDGINDSLAFDSADVGIAVVEETGSFFPSCDGILRADELSRLGGFISMAKFSRVVLMACFSFSFIYNLIGLYFAVTQQLTPLFAAVLMPLSSVSVVGLAYVMLKSKRF